MKHRPQSWYQKLIFQSNMERIFVKFVITISWLFFLQMIWLRKVNTRFYNSRETADVLASSFRQHRLTSVIEVTALFETYSINKTGYLV